MSKSDFFVVITIVLAIVALFSEQNRKYILYKFSYLERLALICFLVVIHILVWSNEWFWWKGSWTDIHIIEEKSALFRKTVTFFNIDLDVFPTPSTYAYIVFLFVLVLVCLNIKYGSFSKRYLDNLVDDYKILADENKMERLYNLIKRYHSEDLLSYLEKKNSLIKKRDDANKKINEEEKRILDEEKKKISREIKLNKINLKEEYFFLNQDKETLRFWKQKVYGMMRQRKKLFSLKPKKQSSFVFKILNVKKYSCCFGKYIKFLYKKMKLVNDIKKEMKKIQQLEKNIGKRNLKIKKYGEKGDLLKKSYKDLDIQLMAVSLNDRFSPIIQNTFISEMNKLENKARFKFAKSIYEIVFKNERFVEKTLEQNTLFYCRYICVMTNVEYENVTQKIMTFLIRNKNISFFREVRNASKLSFFYGSQITEGEFPLLYAIINDCSVYIANSLWYPVGEEAILELREESQKESYLRYEKPDNDYNEDSLFTVSKTFVAINFLNIMTSCVLLQKRDENVWVDYYVFFVKLLLECIDESRKNTAAKTLAYFFIQKICCCLNELLALAVKMNCETNRFLVNNQMNQIKDVIHDTSKLTDADKGNIVDSLRINLGQ